MNFDAIENLSSDDIESLYNNIIEKDDYNMLSHFVCTCTNGYYNGQRCRWVLSHGNTDDCYYVLTQSVPSRWKGYKDCRVLSYTTCSQAMCPDYNTGAC